MGHKSHDTHNPLVIKYYGVEQAPVYQTKGAAGFDIAANEEVYVHPRKTVLVSTGLFLEIPPGYEVQIRPRSGFSIKHDLLIKNAPGTIDSDYRGEIKIILYNYHKSKSYLVRRGDRIAQGVLAKVEQAIFVLDQNHSSTDRDNKGFGSTG